MSKQGIVIPREHGGWAMLIIPYVTGVIFSQATWVHITLFIAWFFFYLASYPFLQAVRKSKQRSDWMKWGMIYSVIAVVFLIPSVIGFPKLVYLAPIMLVLLSINIWHSKQKSERAWLNDLSAILLFCIGAVAAYWVGGGKWDQNMFMIVLFNFVYFFGTVFYVKSVFRERTNSRWLIGSKVYHIIQILIPVIVGYPLMLIPYLFGTVRAFLLGGKQMRPMKVGIIEIVNSIQFLVFTLFLFDLR